jgi:hypothetical protein
MQFSFFFLVLTFRGLSTLSSAAVPHTMIDAIVPADAVLTPLAVSSREEEGAYAINEVVEAFHDAVCAWQRGTIVQKVGSLYWVHFGVGRDPSAKRLLTQEEIRSLRARSRSRSRGDRREMLPSDRFATPSFSMPPTGGSSERSERRAPPVFAMPPMVYAPTGLLPGIPPLPNGGMPPELSDLLRKLFIRDGLEGRNISQLKDVLLKEFGLDRNSSTGARSFNLHLYGFDQWRSVCEALPWLRLEKRTDTVVMFQRRSLSRR